MNDHHRVLMNMRRYIEALLARDWDALAGCVAEDHRFEDRRLGMKSVLDKAGNIAQARVLADIRTEQEQPFDVTVELIETAGDQHALIRQTFRSADYVVPLLVVMEVDEQDLTTVFIVFDESDVDAARSELEALSGSAI